MMLPVWLVVLVIVVLIFRALDSVLGPSTKERWHPNMRTCPTCGARTSASRLVAHAPPPIAPQDSIPPAPPHPQT